MEEGKKRDVPATHSDASRVIFILMKAILLAGILLAASAVALYSRTAPGHVGDSYDDALPFRPRVIYSSSSITVVNTETEPYADVHLTLFVGRSACHASVGTIRPGNLVRIPLSQFKYDDGALFDPNSSMARLLEVRAHFKGMEVHRDLPPPRY